MINLNKKGLTVLSLCDGIGCGKLALERAGIDIYKYIRSEIDDNANFIYSQNHPNDVNLGDVLKISIIKHDKNYIEIKGESNSVFVEGIDLVIFGSECQSFSLQGKQLGFNSTSGQVMLHCIKILNDIKPKFFLAENVRMKPMYQDLISQMIGVDPIKYNSLDFGGVQSRNRLYWTNIKIPSFSEFKRSGNPNRIIIGEGHPMTCRKGKNGDPRSIHRTTHFGCATKSYYKGIRADGRPAIGTVESGTFDENYPHNIRQLTPIEFERLQSLPYDYTKGISKTKRYECVGNAWHVDTVAHIFLGLNNIL